MRAGIYVRVSTQEQKKYGLSVDNQIEALTEYCSEKGYDLVSIYNDAGRSGHAPYHTRPSLLQMIEDCKSNKIDVLLFTKLDRFFRSVADYYACIEQMGNVPWKAIWEDYETVTSEGRFKVNIMLSVAQAEAERTSERVKRMIEFKQGRGDFVGKAAIGYRIENCKLVKDENTREAVEAIFKCYLETFSSKDACDVAKAHGLPMERQHIIKMLHRPVYYGQGANGYQCEPYITEEQYNLIQANMKKHTRASKDPDRIYLFSGLCVCGYCGMRMAGHSVKRIHKSGEIYYQSYSCSGASGSKRSCPHLQMQETHIEQYLLGNIEEILRGSSAECDSITDINEAGEKVKRKKALQAKLKRLSMLYADGDLSISEYRQQRDATKKEIDAIVIDSRSLPELPEGWKDIYADLDRKHKQIFWKKIIDSIEITNETKKAPKITFA